MVGVVFGQRTGVAPGLEGSVSYKRLSFYSSAEYVFDVKNRDNNFFYAWPQLTYAPVNWLRVGIAAQHTKVYNTKLNTDYGPEISVSHKRFYFTSYILNPSQSHRDPGTRRQLLAANPFRIYIQSFCDDANERRTSP